MLANAIWLASSDQDLVVVMYDRSLRSLPLQKQGETAPKISRCFVPLHFTDGFRAHGDLTPSVDDGSLQRKCFFVSV
jgi:hypothetical protein